MTGMGKTAVVTGAASGVGRALAQRLAGDGWRLVLPVRNAQRRESLEGLLKDHLVTFVEADLSDAAEVSRAVDEIRAVAPRIDALFNNAGVMLAEDRRSPQGVEMHAEVNWLTPYRLMRLLRPELQAARGIVVNTSSRAARFGGCPDPLALLRPEASRRGPSLFGAYAKSKLALTAIVAGMAEDYAARGVTLLSVHPGVLATAMTKGEGMPRWLRRLGWLTYGKPERGAEALIDALDPFWRQRPGSFVVDGKASRLPFCIANDERQQVFVEAARIETGL